MSITKAQWAAIETELKGFLPTVNFKLGDDEINISKVRASENKFELGVFINGDIKGDWYLGEKVRPACIEQVWKKKTKAIYSPKRIKEIEKAWGKRLAKKEFTNLHDKITYHLPYFSKASILVRQFKKIEGLELIPKKETE
ncbi:hypothetical protein [Pseudoalteromonas denitrificans]|uniref:Uncharacterized protein n=1 Tax=Pseudoalteromonas denitrificans DSM 6059 TaxID=1123010 RepID=A0A1I1FZ08_9GAMM|nr:hypothetical protein [Pseudoalteromonas denitrificans]SFC04707.1 hypothetical protein SAMN02745724_00752 [Pseudoalteromonas denitrificans DSM 6059]